MTAIRWDKWREYYLFQLWKAMLVNDAYLMRFWGRKCKIMRELEEDDRR